MASHGDRHPTDMAGLRGARLVTSIETEAGQPLGGEQDQGADRRRQDHRPVHAAGFLRVHPAVQADDRRQPQALDPRRRRGDPAAPPHDAVHRHHSGPPKRDKRLADRLLAEWPGILAWAIEGCLEWQRIGLRPPAAVMDATEDYFEAEDAIGRWIDERCRTGKQHWCSAERLWIAGRPGPNATANRPCPARPSPKRSRRRVRTRKKPAYPRVSRHHLLQCTMTAATAIRHGNDPVGDERGRMGRMPSFQTFLCLTRTHAHAYARIRREYSDPSHPSGKPWPPTRAAQFSSSGSRPAAASRRRSDMLRLTRSSTRLTCSGTRWRLLTQWLTALWCTPRTLEPRHEVQGLQRGAEFLGSHLRSSCPTNPTDLS